MRFVETVDKINGLPVGFKEVEYLESTGTQWIDTGINVDTSTDEIKLYFQLIDTTLYKWLFGEYDADARIGLGSGDGPDKRNFLYQQSATKVSDTQMYNKQHLFEINSNGGFLDGTKIRSYVSFASTSTIYLFNLNIDSPSDYRCKSKIWKYEQKRNGVLIRELIPCLDVAGKPCMYDLVEKKAYYNQDTGADFSYGREIHFVEYLESTGTQYIDTGIQPTDDYGYKIKNTHTVGQGEQCAIGCMDNGNRFVGIYTNGSANAISGAWGSFVEFLPSHPWTTDTILDVKCNYKNSRKIVIDDIEMKDISDVHITGTISNSIYIGARHYGSNITKMKGKIYGAEITNVTEVIAEYIPAIDENNVPYMFDRVTHAVYLNAGTGEFLYGNPVASNKGKIRFPVTQHEKSRLPLGFREVEYLESTGGSYIDMGIGVKSNTVVKAIFSIPSTATGRSYFGARNSSNERFQIVNSFGVGGGYFYNANIYPIANQKYEIEMHANGDVYLDGVKRNATNGTFSPVAFDRSLYIFSTNYYDDSGVPSASTFWKVQVFEGDVLVRDFIPCLNNEGTPCMYDLVGKKAYYNQGTGEFSYGREIHYVDYLESDGTQYINTGVKVDASIKLSLDFQMTNITSGTNGIFGASAGQTLQFLTQTSQSGFVFQWTPNSIKYVGVKDTERHTVDLDIPSQSLSVDSASISISDFTFDYPTGNIMLMANGHTSVYGRMKTYGCKIYNNNTQVSNLMPAIDENNVPFMFDRVTHTIFDNAGTGEFLYGNLLKQSKIRIVLPHPIPLIYKPVEYLESTGTQYINTNWIPNASGRIELQGAYTEVGSEYYSTGYYLFAQHGGTNARFNIGQYTNTLTTFSFDITSANRMTDYPLDTNKHIFGINAQTKQTSIDDNVYESTSLADFGSTTYPSYMFARNVSNVAGAFSKAKIYYCKIWDNDTLVRDFIPVIRRADEKPGLYCKVTKQFFTNAGTGEFLYG